MPSSLADSKPTFVHATCVALAGDAVLLTGPSGSGKSDLALRLMYSGWQLIADDRTEIMERNGRLLASCPAVLSGLLEVRGVGIISLLPRQIVAGGPITAVLDLVATPEEVDRMPEPDHVTIRGIDVPKWRVYPFEASATQKAALLLRQTGLKGDDQ